MREIVGYTASANMSDEALPTLTRGAASPRSAWEPRGRLRVVHPPNLHWVLEVGTAPTVIGRVADSSPALSHGTVSRRHLEVTWNEAHDRHVGRDLNSHNGSRVEGRSIGSASAELDDGSVIQLGDVTLVYEKIPPRAPASGLRRGDLLLWLERLYTAWLDRSPPGSTVETLALTPEAAEQILLHPWPSDLGELERLVHELASEQDLPRPIPLHRLPAWVQGADPDNPTVPVMTPLEPPEPDQG